MADNYPGRILMTADTVGGVWTFALELVHALADYGVEVHLATMGRLPSVEQEKEAARVENLVLHGSGFKLEWMDQPWNDVDRAGEWLFELAENIRPDLVHLNNFVHASLPWKIPVVVTGHSCVLSWWRAVKKEEAPARWQEYRLRVGAGLQQADLVTAPTTFMLNQLREIYQFSSPAVVIPNARGAGFSPGFKWPFIFSAGRFWDEAKNLSILAQVSPGLEWKICLAGQLESPDGRKIPETPGIHFLGQVSQEKVKSIMSEASVYVLPAYYEPFGLTVLEAALSGCALVLGRIPSLLENWTGAALFADPDDAMDLKRQLRLLISDENLRKKMSAEALRKASEYNLKQFGENYYRQYCSLMNEPIDTIRKKSETTVYEH